IAIAASDNAVAKARWLAALASGEAVATLAFGGAWAPETWDVEFAEGRATGEVRFVEAASSAHLFLVGLKGGGLALVANGDGVERTPLRSSDHTRRLSTVTLSGAPATPLIAPGDARAQRIFDAALVLVAADALGAATHCVDLSVQYAKDREQFGQPIGRFQALKHQLATMALDMESARALVWYAAYAWDRALPDASRTAALAKAHVCDRFVQTARDAIAAHGGIGYTWDYGLHLWFRRSLFDSAFLGGPAVHRARAAALAGWNTPA
ncbi:MAG: acyl-CoA dehydrogenase family protein, partial [Hyphomonadaceae bacterium]